MTVVWIFLGWLAWVFLGAVVIALLDDDEGRLASHARSLPITMGGVSIGTTVACMLWPYLLYLRLRAGK